MNSPARRSARTACWRPLDDGIISMNTPSAEARSARGFRLGRFPARSAAQHRALYYPDRAGRLLQSREPDLRLARQPGEHPSAGVGHGDHGGWPDVRHPDRRNRSQRRRDRQRNRDRADFLHAAARLRQHRQPADARRDRDRAGARRLLRARPDHRVRRHPHRHPLVHHDAGDDADRRRRLGGAGARADRLYRSAAHSDARVEDRFSASPGSSSSRRSSCSSPIWC